MTPNTPGPNQGELFPDPRPALPPTGWADTSRAAAHAIREHAQTIRERVCDFVAARGARGATIEEIALGLGLRQATVCGRVAELARPAVGPARIADSGARRPTTSGAPAKVWRATEAAMTTTTPNHEAHR
jgi:hypothetical protein